MNSRMSKKSKTTLFLSFALAAVIFSAIHSNQYFMLGTDTQKSNKQNGRFGLEGDYDDFDDDDEYDFDKYYVLGDNDLIIEIEAKQKVRGKTTESTTRTI